jgi:hypothetical protein
MEGEAYEITVLCMSVDLYHFKIVRIQTSKVHETFAPVNMGL